MEKIKEKLKKIRKTKKIVLCHGVFDLVHLGHIKHFKSAKKFGDYLIVSITANEYINKGPGRPIFHHKERLEYLKQIKIIDEVIISESLSAENIIKLVKPHYYVKGPDYKDNTKDKTKKIFREKKLVEEYGGKIIYTDDLTFSSSSIINSNSLLFNLDQTKFIKKIKKKYSYQQISNLLSQFKKIKALVIGELIIDRYVFGEVIGKSGKEPHLVLSEIKDEYYTGGSGAIAKHLSSFVKTVGLLSLLGNENFVKKLIKRDFKKNIKNYFIAPNKNFNTIIKTRFVDIISNYKLFGSYILPEVTKNNLTKKIIKIIEKIYSSFDLILICDYSHYFLNNEIIKAIKSKKKFISVNTQINSSNIGFHTIEKYHGVNSVIINEKELRQELRDKKSNIKILGKQLIKEKKIKNLIITRGLNGVMLIKNNKCYECPAFAKKIVDKVGAGDAMLSICSLCLKNNIDPDLTLFLGSIAAAYSVESIGNKNYVTFENIDRALEFYLK